MTCSFPKFPLPVSPRVVCNDKDANLQPGAEQDPALGRSDIFLSRDAKQAHRKKVREVSNIAYRLRDFWLGRSKLFPREAFPLRCRAFIPAQPSLPTLSASHRTPIPPFPTPLLLREGGRWGAAGGTGGNRAFFWLKLQLSSGKTTPTVQRKL